MKTEMVDFNFDSACTSPYITAPSTPECFGTFFFSAPTSPTRISALYEESNVTYDDDDDDFTFEFSGHELEKSSTPAADELFDGGKIKPSKPVKKAIGPFAEVKERNKNSISISNSSGSSRHKATKSLSPLRDSNLLLFDDNDDENIDTEKTESSAAAACSSLDSISSVSSVLSLWNRTWKLKDLLLFRSASESRASSSREELNKYEIVKKVRQEDAKNSAVSRTRTRQISAHELHYRMKREVMKEMKKKTFLPYKQGLLGCSGLDDTISVYMTRK